MGRNNIRDLAEVQQAVRKYEVFIEEKLKVDLESVLSERDKLYDQISEYHKLKNSIEVMKANMEATKSDTLTTLVELGCNVYGNAKIKDTSKIFVNIGYGFHLEMTFDEALEFIEEKVEHMTKHGDEFTEQANEIKAHIKMVLGVLQDLQFETEFRGEQS